MKTLKDLKVQMLANSAMTHVRVKTKALLTIS